VEHLWAARRIIDERFAEPLTVDQISRAAGLSRYHFIRSFRRAFGCTPGRYLRERRLTRARQLLASSDLPVTDVCFAVGFESLGRRNSGGVSRSHPRSTEEGDGCALRAWMLPARLRTFQEASRRLTRVA
jgi:methylphosphotriester-DNA--protein-cysteine methyltransferase